MEQLDIVVETNLKYFSVDFCCDMFLFHRLDHGFDELLLGLGETVFQVELRVDFGNSARPVDVGF